MRKLANLIALLGALILSTSRRVVITFATLGVLVLGGATATAASAYLHVADAQHYAEAHMWKSFCNYGSNCGSYPAPTGWYDRISDSYVRVEVWAWSKGKQCSRVFAVHGSDSSPYITTDGSSFGYFCT
jgi:hypothetical protein